MTLPQYGLDCEKCTLAELRKFYAQRHDSTTISDVQVYELPAHTCVEALKTLDRASTFRYLDLPADVRVMVLPWLLTYDRSECHERASDPRVAKVQAFPAILRASKLCYREGKEVLLNESTVIQEVRAFHLRDLPNPISGQPGAMEMEKKLNRAILMLDNSLPSPSEIKELRNITIILRGFRPNLFQFKKMSNTLFPLFFHFSGEYWLRLLKIKIICGCVSRDQICACDSVIAWKRWGRFEAIYQEPPEATLKRPRREPEPKFSIGMKYELRVLLPEGTRVVFECFDEKAAARLQGLVPGIRPSIAHEQA